MKRVFVLLFTFFALVLSGCSAADSMLEQAIIESSGITETADYIQYQQYQQAGRLDESGNYIADSVIPASSGNEGKVHVSFAENRYIDVEYYTDAEMLTPIGADSCYLDRGSTIYAKAVRINNPNSNLYTIAEYRIRAYDADGSVIAKASLKAEGGALKYEIPKSFAGAAISIIPIGEYPARSISMRAYCVDDSGNEQTLGNAGEWYVNDERAKESTAQVAPYEAYTVSFKYDKDNYFYVSSEPKCFTEDPTTTGVVEFWEANPAEEGKDYQIELHQYLGLSFKASEKCTVSVNDGEKEDVKKNKEKTLSGLKYGDEIIIEASEDCEFEFKSYSHIRATDTPIASGRHRYTLTITREEKSNLPDVMPVSRIISISLSPSVDHGTCTYKLDGKAVSGDIQAQEGQELTLTYKITDKNYIFDSGKKGISSFISRNTRKETIKIPVSADLNGMSIDPNDYFTIIEKGA